MYRALSPQPRPELEEEELDSAEPVEQRTLGSLVRALEERTGPLLALALAVLLGLVLAAPASASDLTLLRLRARAVALTLPVIGCPSRNPCLVAMTRLLDANTAEVKYLTSRVGHGPYRYGTPCGTALYALRPASPTNAIARYLNRTGSSHEVVVAEIRFLRASGRVLDAC